MTLIAEMTVHCGGERLEVKVNSEDVLSTVPETIKLRCENKFGPGVLTKEFGKYVWDKRSLHQWNDPRCSTTS